MPAYPAVSTRKRPTGDLLARAALVLSLLFVAVHLATQASHHHPATVCLIYLPVILAAFFWGAAAGLLSAAIVAMAPSLLAGESFQAGGTADWLLVPSVGLLIGGTTGLLFDYLRREAKRMRAAAMIDPVSGLPNRPALLAHLEHLIPDPPEATRVCCLLMTFPEYASMLRRLGMHQADELFVAVAARVRDVATGIPLFVLNTDHIAAVTCGSIETLQLYQRHLQQALNHPVTLGDREVEIDARFGMVVGEPGDDAASLLRKAAIALEIASADGSRVAVYDSGVDEAHRRAYSLLIDFRSALRSGDGFALHYQPKVDLASGACIGAEALFRWTHPSRGPVPPGRIMPLIEGSSVMRDVTRWVVRRALQDLRELDEAAPGLRVALNASVFDLEDPEFVHFVQRSLRVAGVDPSRIEIEITESQIMRDFAAVSTTLFRLRKAGVSIAIDDFGTGHSSLAYLDSLPIDSLKIDRAFVQSFGTGRSGSVIIRVATAVAHRLGIRVVAEGVETRDVLDRLRALRVDEAQGFLLGRPVPACDFAMELRQNGPGREGLYPRRS